MHSHLQSYKIISSSSIPTTWGSWPSAPREMERRGYPDASRDRIDLSARIVSVADAFEAMVNERLPGLNEGYEAMKNLLSDNSRRFDPDILKAFIKVMGIYPIGSVVFLSNAAIARSSVYTRTPLTAQAQDHRRRIRDPIPLKRRRGFGSPHREERLHSSRPQSQGIRRLGCLIARGSDA